MNKIEIMPTIKATALASFFNKALADADFTSNVTPRWGNLTKKKCSAF